MQNGKYETSIFLHINGIKNYNNPNISISPNGRFMFYIEEMKEEEKEETEQFLKKRLEKMPDKPSKLIGRV